VERAGKGSRKSPLVVGLLWVSFVGLWFRVYEITTVKDVTDSLYYLTHLITAYGLLVTVWVVHNIRIYRKKGPRLRTRSVVFSDTCDCLNHPINRAVDMHHEQAIIVDVVRGEKFFLDPSASAETGELVTTETT
jgi:hypothetical protein